MTKQGKRKQLKLYFRLITYLKRYWWVVVLSVIGNMLYAGVDSYSAYLLKPLTDKGFMAGDYVFLHRLPLLVLGLFALRGLGSFFATYCTGYVSNKIILTFRSQLFDRFLLLPATFFDKNPSGKLLSAFLYNIDQITQATGNTLTTLVRESCFVIGLLIVMFIASWQLTLIIFMIVPFVVVVVSYVSRRFRRLSRRIQMAMGDVTHITEETISGFKEVRMYGAQAQKQQQFAAQVYYNFVQQMKITLTDALSSPVMQLLGAIVLALMIYLNFRDAAHPIASAGGFVSIMAAMMLLLKPLKNLSQVNASIQKGLTATESIFKLIDTLPEVDDGTVAIEKATGDIAFKQVDFRFNPQGALVLHNVSFNIKAGETVAFVGKSGSGKTTLTHLLARFYSPCAGDVFIDHQSISAYKLMDLRAQIALVSQNVTLFDDSIYNNIAFGSQQTFSEAEVMAAARIAHVLDFSDQLPDGLHTHIGQNGYGLSGGQRQRVAIARAILKNAPILILDEATSSLDNDSEKHIQDAIETLKQGRTTLVIAHRLSTIENADTIYVMSEGQIVEVGTHQQLIQAKGEYASLYRSGGL